MISTERLVLRQWKESDLDFLQSLRNDISLQALLLANARGSDLSSVRKWVKEKSGEKDSLFFLVEKQDSAERIGYIQISHEPGATNVFRFGVCLSTPFQSQGYGSELLRVIETYLMTYHNATKLMLSVDEDNVPAITCYRKLKYREVGTMYRHVLVQARLRNVLIMEKLLDSSMESSV